MTSYYGLFCSKEKGDYKPYMIKKATLINVIELWEGVLILALRLNPSPTNEYELKFCSVMFEK